MPVHDGSKFDAGIFHTFHCSWITHHMESMNGGVLPTDYYGLTEKHAGLKIPDVMTPHRGDESRPNGGRVDRRPPHAGRRLVASSKRSYAILRRTLAVRLVAIVSPGNKDRKSSVADLAEKIQTPSKAVSSSS